MHLSQRSPKTPEQKAMESYEHLFEDTSRHQN